MLEAMENNDSPQDDFEMPGAYAVDLGQYALEVIADGVHLRA